MQAVGASNRPISLQPFGQWSLRVVCGVAALANSRAIGCAPRLATHPAKTTARPLGDSKQALGIFQVALLQVQDAVKPGAEHGAVVLHQIVRRIPAPGVQVLQDLLERVRGHGLVPFNNLL
ncbi:hypothetical protein [Acidovorax sp. 99]|uniref:hypothetical protein n=1 Tax=Acidovorax sp. 99 TaxID=2135634 RepID=UPI001403ACA4|nr:hypothetical protein [Acidovorax sp. 99]